MAAGGPVDHRHAANLPPAASVLRGYLMSKKIVGKGATNEAPGQQHHDQHHVVSSEGAQVVNPGPGGTVTLPEGTTIVSLEADGRDLIIVLSDGEKILVPDGAVVVPEIVVDNTAVPPANIAALLIDNEVQPAAGPTQSSGGNFAADEGAIQSAYGLGNLLPYTELHFELQPRHELFPADVNKEPSVVVETPDNPAGAVDAVATVHEAGLPARDGEPAGTGEAADGNLTNNSDPSETTNGTIVVNSPDGIQAVLINGTAIDHVGQTFTSPDGTLKITSIDLAAGRIGFSYTLVDNLLGQTTDGPFQVTVIDSDGDQATATLHINVVDDAPIAAADTDTVAAGTYGPESGNVITGDGTTSGAAGADRVGADDASVSAVSHGEQNVTADESGTMVIAGDYGTLTIHDDGSYTYVRNAGTSGGVDDRFTYTLTDGDGSTDTATLTIHIDDSPAVVTSVPETGDGTIVDETGLPPHDGGPVGVGEDSDGIPNNNSDTSETTHGTISFTAPDGPASVEINNTVITGANQVITIPEGTLTITAFDPAAGTLDYSFTLTNNTSGDNTSVTFTVTVTDVDGDSDSAPFTIHIVDDTPLATPDADSVTEDGPLTADGNVLTGSGGSDANTTDGVADSQGADGAHVTAVAFGATAGTVGTGLAGAYGTLTLNSDGSYSYALDNTNALVQGLDKNEHLTETFTYTITDGDGDPSTTTLTITINGADDGVTIGGLNADGAEQTVYEANLADGSAPDAAALTQTGTFTVTAQDGLATISVGGHTVYTGDAFVPGQTVSTAYGTLTITGVTPTTTDANGDVTAATVSYSYELTDNTLAHTGANDVSLTDSFDITVTDTDGSTANDHLEVTVVDDTPLATPDADSVTEDGPLTADGNVLTGSGGSDANTTDGVADSQGADGAHVTAVAFGATAGTVGTGLAGAYGTLTLNSDGSYSYALDNTNALVQGLDKNEHLTETFTYTITDGDGDPSTTTLTITINGADDGVTIGGLNADGAEQTVYEANLADGSAPDAAALTQTGTFTVTAQDGLATISVGGHTVYTGDAFVPGQTVSTAYGTLTITGVTPTTTDANGDVTAATVSYSYELTDNTLAHTGANDVSLTDSFDITVTDTDGSTANDHLEVTVVDDTPLAFDNSNTVDEGGSVGGNVLSDGTPDVFGADGKGGVATFTDGVHTAAPGGTIETALGFLTINADGSYDYESKPNSTSVDTHDTFTYTIVDADGDTSPATLTIDITATAGNVSDNDVSVDESGLDNGTYTGSQLVPNGEFDTNGQISATGGTPPYSYVLTSPADGTYGTLALNGSTGAYSYTLDTPFTDAVNENSRNVVNGAESFTYDVYDNLGNFIGSGSISVNITDDVPTAVDDALQTLAEDAAGTIGGNVMANDTQGADGASVTSVNIGGVDHAIAAVGTTTVDTANGHYTFQADGTWTFDPNTGLDQSGGPIDASFTYTLTDGDGDHDTATQPISITDGAGPTGGDTLSLTVDDGALADGNNSASGAEVDAGQLTFTAGSDALTTFAFGTDLSALGGGLTWTRVDATTITGKDGANLVVTLKLTAPASIGAGASGDVTVTATLADNYAHHPGLGDDLQALGNVTVVASDQDGDSATGTVSLSVSDDVPTIAVIGDTSVVEGQTATGTWSESVGADSPGTTVAVFNGTEYALGTAINTGKGTLTVNANGTWSFTANSNLDNSVAQGITFSVKVTDADHDVATDPQTITITDGAGPTGGDTLSLTVDDGALADGNNSASGAEVDAGQLTFTAGSDALTTFAFGTDLSALGGGLTWTRVDATTITGKDGANLVVTLKLTAPASIGAGASGDVTVTATLADNYAHHPGLGDDLQALGNVTVVASDQDGDSATGTVSLSVSDDVPVAVVADAVSVNNVAGGDNLAFLDADHNVANNYGADGPGAVIFTASTLTSLQGQNLSSGLASLDYAITNGGTTLTATKSTDHSVVFTVNLQPAGHANQYDVHINQPLDSLQTVDFNNGGYNFVGGNGSWAGFTQPGDNNSQDLLLSPIGAGTVNTNANEGGVGSGNSVGSGEAMRVDYVIDLNGSPVSGGNFNGGDNTQTFDGHYTVNGGSALFTHTTNSNVHIAAFDDNDSGTLKNVGDGAPDAVNKIAISYNAGSSVITSNGTYSVGGHNFTVTFNANGTVNVSGVTDGARIAAYTDDGYNSIEWGYASGDTFKIGDFGATVISKDPVPFTVPISIIDGDGDTVSSGNLSITANPVTPPVALDLNGDGLHFLGLDAGVTHDYGHGAVATAWTTPGDGILAHDTGHGLDVVFTDDAVGARTDLQGLELAYDSNHDGQLTSADAAWSSFGVWQDANSNGVVDAGEFKTLSQAGVTAIGLSTDGQAYSTAGGDVTVLGTGSFTRADGTTAALGDTVFATAAKQISQQTSELSVAAAALGGFMAVPLVHAAMAPTAPEQVTTLAHALRPDAPLGSMLGEHVAQPIGTANLQLTTETAPAAPHSAAGSGGSHQALDSDNAHLPDASHATVTTEQLPDQATLAVESAPAPGAHGPSDVGLMEALLTMHQGGNGAHAAAAADDGHGAVTTENMPKIAAVLNDALAGHAVDQIVDKFAGWHPNSTQAAGQPPVAANAEHAPAVLDLHLDTHTDTHAALFATMMAMPTVEEHVVAAA